jgi:FixJ family two-component response regulator
MIGTAVTVFVVDDDPAVLKALERLLRSEGYHVRAFSSASAFLSGHDFEAPGCVVLDLSMPETTGLELQQKLAALGDERAVVFISGHGDIPSSVRAMKGGALDFLTKPFDDVDLLAAVKAAIGRDLYLRAMRAERRAIRERLAALTAREHEVLLHVVAGRINKQIASDLGTVEKTIKVHRARVMDKMGVDSVAELARLCERAGIGAAPPHTPE